MKSISRIRVLMMSASLPFLSGCELAPEKREVTSDDSVILAYFQADQYAVNYPELRDFMSSFIGSIVAAEPSGNFNAWANPEFECDYTQNYMSKVSTGVGIRRSLEISSIQVDNSTEVLELTKSKYNEFYYFGFLGFGPHSLRSTGVANGAVKFNQDFQVLAAGGNIGVTNLADGEVTQVLSSPELPSENESSYNVVFKRNNPIGITYNAPEGTDYVRIRLKDGSNTAIGDITCTGPANEAIIIPQGALNTFRTGSQAYFELDFVDVSRIRNTAKVKESIVLSSMKHFQGTFEYINSENIKETIAVGLISIE